MTEPQIKLGRPAGRGGALRVPSEETRAITDLLDGPARSYFKQLGANADPKVHDWVIVVDNNDEYEAAIEATTDPDERRKVQGQIRTTTLSPVNTALRGPRLRDDDWSVKTGAGRVYVWLNLGDKPEPGITPADTPNGDDAGPTAVVSPPNVVPPADAAAPGTGVNVVPLAEGATQPTTPTVVTPEQPSSGLGVGPSQQPGVVGAESQGTPVVQTVPRPVFNS